VSFPGNEAAPLLPGGALIVQATATGAMAGAQLATHLTPGDNPAVGTGVGQPAVTAAMSDAELVRACRQRNELAWGILVERFSRYVYAIAVQAYRLSVPDAEDVFQEVFTRTYEHLDRLQSDEAIRPWIGQLTRRLAIDKLRLASRESPGAEALDVVEGQAERQLEQIELALGVRAAMEALPEHCQEILDRFFARGDSYHEISAALDIPMGTIASRISRCLAKLRAELGDGPK
jgi:RNA polymerase sigma factor (sigma-70 family)